MTTLPLHLVNDEAMLLILTALTAGGLFVIGAWSLEDGRGRASRRIDMVRKGASASPTQPSASSDPASLRRHNRSALRPTAVARLTSLMPQISNLQLRLVQGGLDVAASDIIIIGLAIVSIVTVLGYFLLAANVPLASALGLLFGVGVPHTLLSWQIKRRRRNFVSDFPDVIDLIVRGVRSGLPVVEAIQEAGRESGPVVSELFAEIAGNLQIGMSLEDAMWTAARRLELQELKFFVISLSIQQETGGNVAEILSNLSKMMRRRQQVKMRIRAMSSEAKASATIIGALPFVMILLLYVVNRDYIMLLFLEPMGWLLLGAASLSMCVGILIMRRMVRFEI